jgi:hypothetical protein
VNPRSRLRIITGFYTLRRIRDSFRARKSLADSTKIMEAVQKAEENLEIIKRQVVAEVAGYG